MIKTWAPFYWGKIEERRFDLGGWGGFGGEVIRGLLLLRGGTGSAHRFQKIGENRFATDRVVKTES